MNSTYLHIWKLCAVLALVGFLLIIVFLFLPYTASVYEKYSVLSSQKEQIKMMGNWQEQLSDIEQKQQMIDKGMQQMMIDLASEHELTKIVEQFYSIAGQTMVSVTKIQPMDSKRENGYLIKSVQVDASGSYHSLARFINQLEQSGMMVGIQHLDMEPSEDISGLLESSLILEITFSEED